MKKSIAVVSFVLGAASPLFSMGNAVATGVGTGMGVGMGMGIGSGVATSIINGNVSPASVAIDIWFFRWLTRSKYERPNAVIKRITLLQDVMKVQSERLVRRRQEAKNAFVKMGKIIKEMDAALAQQEKELGIVLPALQQEDDVHSLLGM